MSRHISEEGRTRPARRRPLDADGCRQCSEEEFQRYRRGFGFIMGCILTEVMHRIYPEHLELEPKRHARQIGYFSTTTHPSGSAYLRDAFPQGLSHLG
jgi:hypothetical protein